jgi:hypothetical protein
VYELARDDPLHFKELVFAFFPHVIGIHNWEKGVRFNELFNIDPETPLGKSFRGFRFSFITECPHDLLDDNATNPIEPNTPAIQKLLELLAKTAFLNDIVRVKWKSATSALEAYHSVRLRYAPKRKFFAKKGAEIKSMLAIMHWNTVQLADRDGNRRVVAQYQSYSKPRGEHRTVTRMNIIQHPWKRILVERTIEHKRQHGPGLPIIDDNNEELDEEVSSRQK